MTRMVNSPEDRPYFENKLLFCRTFAPYLGRSFLDLNEAGEDALADFLRHHPVVFLKEPESFGGLGVKRFDSAGTDLNDREAVKGCAKTGCKTAYCSWRKPYSSTRK